MKIDKIIIFLKKEIQYIPQIIREDIKYEIIFLGLAVIINFLLSIFFS